MESVTKKQLNHSAQTNIKFIQNWFDYRFMDLKNQAKDRHNIELLEKLHEGFRQSKLSLENYVKSADWKNRLDSNHNQLSKFLHDYDYIYDVFLVDLQGNILYTVKRQDDLGSNFFESPLVETKLADSIKHTIQERTPLFSDLEHYPPSNNDITGFITSLLYNEEKEAIGVFAIQIRFDRIFSLLTNTRPDPYRQYLVNHEGLFRTSPDSSKENIFVAKHETKTFKNYVNSGRNLTIQKVDTYTNYDNETVFGIHNRLNIPGVNWYLISQISKNEAMRTTTWLGLLTFIIVGILSLIAITLSILISRTITLPISRLAVATNAVAAGKLDIQLDTHSKNEIGQLSLAFNRMIVKRRLFEHKIAQGNLQLQNASTEIVEQKYALDQHSIVGITDTKGIITYANDKFCLISGYSREELIGENHQVLDSNFHSNGFFLDMYKTIGQGNVWQGEICDRSKNGELYWVDTTIVPFIGQDKKPRSYVAIQTDITRQKKALHKLQESEERYSLAMSVANDGIWDWKIGYENILFDDRYYTMAGYRAEEFPQNFDEWEKHVHPDDLNNAKAVLNQYLAGKILKFETEFRFLRKDSTYMWILSKGEFVAYDGNGNPTRMIGTHSDITKRKLASKALVSSEKNLLIAQKTARIGHYCYDIKSANWTCSEELERIFGVPSNYQRNLDEWFRIVHPDDRKKMTDYLQNYVIRDHHLFDIEYRIIDLEKKQEKWVHGIGNLRYDDENNPIQMVGTIQDITHRKKIELALKKSNDQRTLLVNTIPHGIQENDTNGKITFSNTAHHLILERGPGEMVGRYIWDSEVDGEHTQRLKDYFAFIVREQPEPEPYVTYSMTKTGKEILLEIVWNYQKDELGNLIGFISIISDVTQQRKSEIALQRAQKMEAIGQLTGGIAHDFNNILGVIIGNLDLLSNQFENDVKAQKRITSASKAASRAEELTKKLLGFSRNKVTEKMNSDINQTIKSMDDVISHTLNRSVVLTYQLQPDLWFTQIDRGDLQDALLNLVRNSQDALESSENPKLTMTTSNTKLDESFCLSNEGAKPGEYILLSISDNGEGIAEETLPNIFEPFFTTKVQGKGTGLGLAMVFGFVKRSGGYIQVDSAPQQGTSFKLFLPRCLDSIEEKPIISEAKKIESTPLNLEGFERLLIVDDESDLLTLAQSNLLSLGYQVITADDGVQALEQLSSHPDIDLLFTDVVMSGGISGYQLAEKTSNLYPDIKILLTSGYTGKAEESNKNLSNRHFELLKKPYNQKQLAICIRKLLDERNEHQQLGASKTESQYPTMSWTNSLSIGVSVIDNDHKKLIAIFNKINLQLAEKMSDYSSSLKELFDFCSEHFVREEVVMSACNFPELKNHKQVHALLLKQLAQMLKQEQQNELSPVELNQFLIDWLIQHIRSMDANIEPYTKGKSEKIKRALSDLSHRQLKD